MEINFHLFLGLTPRSLGCKNGNQGDLSTDMQIFQGEIFNTLPFRAKFALQFLKIDFRELMMKCTYFLLLPMLFLNFACKQTDKSANTTPGNNPKIESFNESTEYSVKNETIVNVNNSMEKSIQYISWEDVIWFINYERFRLSTYDRMTGGGDEYYGTYTLDISDNITFLNVHFDNENDERWLILANGTLCDIYKSDGKHIQGVTGSVNRTEIIWIWSKDLISASSYLQENNFSYLPNNLSIDYKTDNPWVEGVDGLGINEKIYFEKRYVSNGSMHISIGYVSYNKPYLYNQNSRPKRIKLSVENKFSIIADLKDTPHYQEIKFPSDITMDDILILEILDVYPGTKYEDTCINTIFFEESSGFYETIQYWKD
jgi:hypothetical protein